MLTFLGKWLKIQREEKVEWETTFKRNEKREKNNKGKASNMIAVTEIIEIYPNKLVLTINANGLKYYSKRQRISNSIR